MTSSPIEPNSNFIPLKLPWNWKKQMLDPNYKEVDLTSQIGIIDMGDLQISDIISANTVMLTPEEFEKLQILLKRDYEDYVND